MKNKENTVFVMVIIAVLSIIISALIETYNTIQVKWCENWIIISDNLINTGHIYKSDTVWRSVLIESDRSERYNAVWIKDIDNLKNGDKVNFCLWKTWKVLSISRLKEESN